MSKYISYFRCALFILFSTAPHPCLLVVLHCGNPIAIVRVTTTAPMSCLYVFLIFVFYCTPCEWCSPCCFVCGVQYVSTVARPMVIERASNTIVTPVHMSLFVGAEKDKVTEKDIQHKFA